MLQYKVPIGLSILDRIKRVWREAAGILFVCRAVLPGLYRTVHHTALGPCLLAAAAEMYLCEEGLLTQQLLAGGRGQDLYQEDIRPAHLQHCHVQLSMQ